MWILEKLFKRNQEKNQFDIDEYNSYDNKEFKNHESKVLIALGQDINGNSKIIDLDKTSLIEFDKNTIENLIYTFSKTDSNAIINMIGAEKLLENGDILYCSIGMLKPIRVQGSYISEENIVEFLKKKNL